MSVYWPVNTLTLRPILIENDVYEIKSLPSNNNAATDVKMNEHKPKGVLSGD